MSNLKWSGLGKCTGLALLFCVFFFYALGCAGANSYGIDTDGDSKVDAKVSAEQYQNEVNRQHDLFVAANGREPTSDELGARLDFNNDGTPDGVYTQNEIGETVKTGVDIATSFAPSPWKELISILGGAGVTLLTIFTTKKVKEHRAKKA